MEKEKRTMREMRMESIQMAITSVSEREEEEKKIRGSYGVPNCTQEDLGGVRSARVSQSVSVHSRIPFSASRYYLLAVAGKLVFA